VEMGGTEMVLVVIVNVVRDVSEPSTEEGLANGGTVTAHRAYSTSPEAGRHPLELAHVFTGRTSLLTITHRCRLQRSKRLTGHGVPSRVCPPA
jgi:hypothetical protein